jgi:hypothetical protein
VDETQLIIGRLLLERYSRIDIPYPPNRLGFSLKEDQLRIVINRLHLFGLLSSTPGFGGFDKYKITKDGYRAVQLGLKAYLLRNELMKPAHFSDHLLMVISMKTLSIVNAILTAISIIITAIAIVIGLFF